MIALAHRRTIPLVVVLAVVSAWAVPVAALVGAGLALEAPQLQPLPTGTTTEPEVRPTGEFAHQHALVPAPAPVATSDNGFCQSPLPIQASGLAPGRGLKSGVPSGDFVPNPAAGPYKRPSGAGPTAAQKRAVQGQPCVDCGAVTQRQVADHIDPLVVEHYRTGTIDKTKQTAIDAVQPHCPTCSATQGGQLSAFSRRMRQLLGLD